MRTDAIIRAVKARHPKTYRRLQLVAEAKKLTMAQAVVLCLAGETTQGPGGARTPDGRSLFFGRGVKPPTNER